MNGGLHLDLKNFITIYFLQTINQQLKMFLKLLQINKKNKMILIKNEL